MALLLTLSVNELDEGFGALKGIENRIFDEIDGILIGNTIPKAVRRHDQKSVKGKSQAGSFIIIRLKKKKERFPATSLFRRSLKLDSHQSEKIIFIMSVSSRTDKSGKQWDLASYLGDISARLYSSTSGSAMMRFFSFKMKSPSAREVAKTPPTRHTP